MEPGRGFDLHEASFPVLSVLCGLGGYEGCGCFGFAPKV